MITAASIIGVEAHVCTLTTASRKPTTRSHHALAWPGLGGDSTISDVCEGTSYALRSLGTQPLDIIPLDRTAEQLAHSSSRGYQLAFTIAALVHWDLISKHAVAGLLFHGELTYDGRILPATGTYAVALAARSRKLTVVTARAVDFMLGALDGVDVVVVDTLAQLLAWLTGEAELPEQPTPPARPPWRPSEGTEVSSIRISSRAKLAVELAISGGHSLLLYGPMASGKSMLVRAAAGLLPEPSEREAEQISSIHQLAHRRLTEHVTMPYRMPHHTCSHAGLLGGSTPIRPGEVTLAHNGVLVLEELAEYPASNALDVLHVHETQCVELMRRQFMIQMPCSFTLIATMWPCPCGRLGWTGEKPCSCSPASVARYRNRVLQYAQRFDMIVDVAADSEPIDLGTNAQIRERIAATRATQVLTQGDLNAWLPAASLVVSERGELPPPLGILRVARTIADRAGSDQLLPEHIELARNLWWVPEPVATSSEHDATIQRAAEQHAEKALDRR